MHIVYLVLLAVALAVAAVAGWTAKGVRQLAAAATPQPRRRPGRVAPAA